MRQAANHHSGRNGAYSWIVCQPGGLPSIAELVVRHHDRERLIVVAFDGGRVFPNADALRGGWSAIENMLVSPPLCEGINIPHEGDDEWCVLPSAPNGPLDLEAFVCYGGFTLLPPDLLYASYDPTWDKHGLDFLIPIQERFWDAISRIRPTSYIVLGDFDIIVSRNAEFVGAVRAAVESRLD